MMSDPREIKPLLNALADQVNTIGRARRENPSQRRVVWLIETQQKGVTVWWGGANGPGWTADANEALWFGRQRDAETAIKDQRGLRGEAAEHVFLGADE